MDDTEVAGLLTRALTAIDVAQVPEDLREVAFTNALALLNGGLTPAPAGLSASTLSAALPASTVAGAGASSESGLLDKIAAAIGIELAKIKRVFAEQDGAPQLIVKSNKLPKAKAAAAHDIALLLMAGRQLGGLDDYTDAAILREVVKRYGKFDRANFAGQMKALDHYILTEGKGASTKRKLTHPGIEAAAEMVDKYATQE
jgi:hypothetical protein